MWCSVMKHKLAGQFKGIFRANQLYKDNSLIFRQLKSFPKLTALSILLPLLAALFDGFGLGFLLGFFQNLVAQNGKVFRTGLTWFDDYILDINGSDLERLIRISLLVLLATWLRALFNYLTIIYQKKAEEKLVNQLYKKIFEQLQSLSLSFYGQVKSGDVINTLTAEVNQLRIAVVSWGGLISSIANITVYVFVAFWISLPLTFLSVALLGLVVLGVTSLNRQVREASFLTSQTRSNFVVLVSQLVNGIRTIKSFATEDFEREKIYQASDEVMAAGLKLGERTALAKPISESLASTILIGIIVLAMAVFVPNGSLEVASILTFLFTLFRIVPQVQGLNGRLALLGSMRGAVSHIEELLRQDNKVYLSNGSQYFRGLKKQIQFVDVCFGYEPSEIVLQNINLTIEQGKTTALVGASGSGKSTLIDLIPRFYDITSGKILFDGVEQKKFDLHSLRRKIGIVSQDTFIFNSTIKENIAYGSGVASYKSIEEAARRANALDFINELPQRFDTVLGDRGVRLSGGQRQRIAIARALLFEPEILILDEATSALDSVSEQLIKESLDILSKGRTVITIAHRLSTISNADKVVVIESGRIVEQGRYDDLLEKNGALWRYHSMQAS